MNSQQLIDNCQKHGVINWKVLKELVWLDVEKAVKNKEYKQWKTKY